MVILPFGSVYISLGFYLPYIVNLSPVVFLHDPNNIHIPTSFIARSSPKQPTDDDDLPCDDDDGLPDTLSGDELTDKRYKGGHIPSRSFKVLQMSVGNNAIEQNGKNSH